MRRGLLVLLALICCVLTAGAEPVADYGRRDKLKILAVRLKPDQDLKKELQLLVVREKLQAGFIVSAVGSLKRLNLRLADQADSKGYEGPFEIVSLTGTLSPQGLHLHLSASDKTGKTLGGHLVDGNIIYTTVELVVGVPETTRFWRTPDPASGYPELDIQPRREAGGGKP